MSKNRHRSLLLLILASVFCYTAHGESGDYDIYYLVIGSGLYAEQGYERPSALFSAKLTAELLKGLPGYRNGLIAPDDLDHPHIVTRDEVREKIYQLKQIIRADKPKNPLIVIYYMGHALGNAEGVVFFTLGNFKFSQNLAISVHDKNLDPLYKTEDVLADTEIAMSLFSFSLNDDRKHLDEVYRSPPSLLSCDYTNDDNRDCINEKMQLLGFKATPQNHASIHAKEFKNRAKLRVYGPNYRGKIGAEDTDHARRSEYFKAFIEELHIYNSTLGPVMDEDRPTNNHVPYIIITDSCFDGIKTVVEREQRGQPKKTAPHIDMQELDSIFSTMLADLRANGINSAILKKYGTMFYSATPGSASQPAIDSPDNQRLYPGTMAKRLELALIQTRHQKKPVSLRQFLETLANKELYILFAGTQKLNLQEPFFWFSPPSDDKFNAIFYRP